MTYTDCNTSEFNSLVSIVRPLERYNTSLFLRSKFHKLAEDDFINSSAAVFISNSLFDLENSTQINTLSDNDYINFLNKIEKDFKYVESEYSLFFINDKFSKIYNELSAFNFEKMSIELTYDNALVFAIKNVEDKFLIQYYFDFNSDSEDDVEVIFSNLNRNNNNFIETRLEGIKSLIENELAASVII
ncbi:hypothetical protein [Flavobacterium columnare]|uniref:hypothetical protein n=1 Tax=Flavobacterium columnare TaxID=996 RepID=UPI0013D32F09|nr:hypothetical protein [Flavobacterium columnare]